MLTRLASHGGSTRERRISLVLVAVVLAMGVVFWPTGAAQADPSHCTLKQWSNPSMAVYCAKQLPAASDTIASCEGVPTPSAPDSGFGGWFASDPHVKGGVAGLYSTYGYAGYSYPMYSDCSTSSALPSTDGATTTIANGELMVATGIIGAANAFREWAYQPDSAWGWSNDLVKTATREVYQKVFSLFGVITIAVVGVYLVWRSRQANMSDALTTAGWAILVMVVVTAVASWPLISAHLADSTLVTSLGIIHSAIGPQPKNIPVGQCPYADPNAKSPWKYDPGMCKDHRSPAVLASDTATQSVLYDNWLRGTLGSSTSMTAQKYGLALYISSSLSWNDEQRIQNDPSQREIIYKEKNDTFERVAQQIKTEDPDAYDYLQGKEGTARIGAGLIAIISAVAFAFFDIAASILIIMGFLIFRWAVVATPVVGTVAILRPASAGFKRLINMVVAAIFNIIIFGAGASIYLFAVDIIMNTTTLPGWLQVTLVWLCGVVGWLMLRPYRRITQLGGKNPAGEVANIGSWHSRFFADLRSFALGTRVGSARSKNDDEAEKTTGSRARQTEDQESPVTAGETERDEKERSGRPRREDQPVPVTVENPVSVDFDERVPVRVEEINHPGDERVWDAESDRYLVHNELEDMVREAEAAMSRGFDGIERELRDTRLSEQRNRT